MEYKSLYSKIIQVLLNRIFIMSLFFVLSFLILIVRLFNLQIVNGSEYQQGLKATTVKTIPISAPRGNIYDKYGRPLAINRSAYNLSLDLSLQIKNSELNTGILNLISLLKENGQEYVDDFPITKTEPYEFTFESEGRELTWKENMGIKEEFTAQETVDELLGRFDIKKDLPSLPKEKQMDLLSVRAAMYMERFRSYKPLTLAYDISDKIVVAIDEQNEKFPGVFIDVQSLREYPKGKYFSHILGYTGKLTKQEEYDKYSKYGYVYNDIIGKSGIEDTFELDLSGENGTRKVEVNRYGKRSQVLEEEPAINGNDIYLTIDANLQEKAYGFLEATITETLQKKLISSVIKQSEFLISLVESNSISMPKILNSNDESASSQIRDYIYNSIDNQEELVDIENIKKIIAEGIKTGRISGLTIILVLHEQGIISGDESYINDIKRGRISTLQAILDKLSVGEITPQMTNLDPSTGSVVVVEVGTGNVLSAVSYPSYDNNELVNNMNNEYYMQLLSDPSTPLINRAFSEPRAPGSTFKMITAIAGLESGVITPKSTISDRTSFTKAGNPPVRSWSTRSLGVLNVSQALEVSSNYFFSDVSYNLGSNDPETLGIDILNKYMIAFGLNDRTGVEIGEYRDSIEASLAQKNIELSISSPEFSKFLALSADENAEESSYRWRDGDTVRTAIGQSNNNYTAASMAKYISTIATRGERYKLNLVSKLENSEKEVVREFLPVLEYYLDVKEENLDAVIDGMVRVTTGSKGTARQIFSNFEIPVAGKTGTAEQVGSRSDHSSFGGFAPIDSPEIAVYVMIPFGDSKYNSAAATQVARNVIAEYMGVNSNLSYKEITNSLLP